MPETQGVPVAYNRISKFRVARGGVEAEVSRGVDRQAADAETAARDLDLGAVVHFTDEGQSASAYATKERTDWPEFLSYVASGQASHALVWVLDRAARTTEGADDFLAACRTGGALIVQTATMQVADPNNIHDVHNLKSAALQAEYEVAKMSMRQRRAKAEAVKMGRPHGGRRRFGYEPGMTKPRESEAAVIRELVSRFLAGESLRGLATWLNSEGVKGANGGTWSGPNLRHLLGGPHLAGWRVHGRDANGRGIVVGKGTWDAIIDPEVHDHVTALLNNPARRTNGSTNARVYLLAGLMVCDECGTPCRGKPRTGRNESPAYLCPTGRHVHRPTEKVDRVVELAAVARLSDHNAEGLFVADEAGAEVTRLRDARDAMGELLADYAARASTMHPDDYAAATGRIRADMDALDVQLKGARAQVRQGSRVLKGATGAGAAEAWFGTDEAPGWSLSRKRAILSELFEIRLVGGRHVTPTGTAFHDSDVRILPRIP